MVGKKGGAKLQGMDRSEARSDPERRLPDRRGRRLRGLVRRGAAHILLRSNHFVSTADGLCIDSR